MNTASFPRKTLAFAASVTLVNLLGAYALDAAGLVEKLLSPHGSSLVVLLPLAVLFYAARIVALFVAPGLLLGALVVWGIERRRDGAEAKPR